LGFGFAGWLEFSAFIPIYRMSDDVLPLFFFIGTTVTGGGDDAV